MTSGGSQRFGKLGQFLAQFNNGEVVLVVRPLFSPVKVDHGFMSGGYSHWFCFGGIGLVRGNMPWVEWGVSETLCMRFSPCGFDGSFIEPFWV
jgi:hypothetical protein